MLVLLLVLICHLGASSNPGRRTSANALLHVVGFGSSLGVFLPSTTSELTAYLDSGTITQFDDDLNVLTWWREHKPSYHVLSIYS